MDAEGARHVLIHRLVDAARGALDREAERVRNPLLDCRMRERATNRDAAVAEVCFGEEAQNHGGVGQGRRVAAAVVAGGPRRGAGAAWPDRDHPAIVDRRDAATAGADLDEIDRRDHERKPAAGLEGADARHLERALHLDLARGEESALRSRAAHIEGEDVRAARLGRLPVALGYLLRGEHAGGRAGLDHAHRVADAALEAHRQPRRGHHQGSAGKAQRAQLLLEAADVIGDERHGVGVDRTSRPTLVFALRRRDCRRAGHVGAWIELLDPAPHQLLVRRIAVGMEETDSKAAEALRLDNAT